MRSTKALALFVLAVPLAVATSARANPRAEALLGQLGFSAKESKSILAGELVTVASKEKTSDKELAITMAFLVREPPNDLVDQFATATAYDTDSNATAYGEFHGDGDVADLEKLKLTPNGDAEAKRFADASPGDDENLSGAEIAALRALPDKSTAAIEADLRKLLLARPRLPGPGAGWHRSLRPRRRQER